MTEHEDLIARLRNSSGVRTSDVNALMDEAADSLEKVAVERDNWKLSAEEAERAEQRAEQRAEEAERERDRLDEAFDRDLPWRYDEVEAQRNQLAAVVERAKGWATRRVPGFTVENQMAEVADALMEAPSVSLDRVKAEALREAADYLDSFEGLGGRQSAHDRAGRDIIRLIRDRADHIEKGESNDQ